MAAVRSSAAALTGKITGKTLEVILDSGSAVSLVMKQEFGNLKQNKLSKAPTD